jgi:hypothetical protein
MPLNQSHSNLKQYLQLLIAPNQLHSSHLMLHPELMSHPVQHQKPHL